MKLYWTDKGSLYFQAQQFEIVINLDRTDLLLPIRGPIIFKWTSQNKWLWSYDNLIIIFLWQISYAELETHDRNHYIQCLMDKSINCTKKGLDSLIQNWTFDPRRILDHIYLAYFTIPMMWHKGNVSESVSLWVSEGKGKL